MTAIAKELDAKLKLWSASTAQRVEKLIAEIIVMADRQIPPAKRPRKVSSNRDRLLTDKKVFRGKTPQDLAANHDRYLYGE